MKHIYLIFLSIIFIQSPTMPSSTTKENSSSLIKIGSYIGIAIGITTVSSYVSYLIYKHIHDPKYNTLKLEYDTLESMYNDLAENSVPKYEYNQVIEEWSTAKSKHEAEIQKQKKIITELEKKTQNFKIKQ